MNCEAHKNFKGDAGCPVCWMEERKQNLAKIKALQDICVRPDNCREECGVWEAWIQDLDVIDRLREESRWIPVGERLPEARNKDTEWSDKVEVAHVRNRYIGHDWYLAKQGQWKARGGEPYTHWRSTTLPEQEGT